MMITRGAAVGGFCAGRTVGPMPSWGLAGFSEGWVSGRCGAEWSAAARPNSAGAANAVVVVAIRQVVRIKMAWRMGVLLVPAIIATTPAEGRGVGIRMKIRNG